MNCALKKRPVCASCKLDIHIDLGRVLFYVGEGFPLPSTPPQNFALLFSCRGGYYPPLYAFCYPPVTITRYFMYEIIFLTHIRIFCYDQKLPYPNIFFLNTSLIDNHTKVLYNKINIAKYVFMKGMTINI